MLGTYPRSPGAVAICGGRCLRRDVDAHPSFTWQRPAPGRRARMARDPGGSLRPLPPRRPAMEPVCGNRPEGSRCERFVRATGCGGKPKHRSGARNRRTRVPKGNPGTVRSQGALQQGSQGDLPESPGASPPPGCRVGTRVPVAPPRGIPRDGRRVEKRKQSGVARPCDLR